MLAPLSRNGHNDYPRCMNVSKGRVRACAANPPVRTVLFLLGASTAGSTLMSLLPGPLGFLLAMISLLVIIISMIVVLVGAGSALISKRWWLSGQRLLVLAVAATIVPMGLRSGDYVHLALLYPYYHEKIARTSKRPVWFPWGDQAVTVLDGLQRRTLLFDDTGATTASTDTERDNEGLCTFRKHLIGSFFIELLSSC